MTRRTHSPEFKQEAIRLARNGSSSRAQVARDLGIHPNLLRLWLEKYPTDAVEFSADRDQPMSLEAENLRLRRELVLMTEERDALKKVLGYYVKDSG